MKIVLAITDKTEKLIAAEVIVYKHFQILQKRTKTNKIFDIMMNKLNAYIFN